MTEGEKEWRLDSTSDEQKDGNERERTRGAERSEERNRGINRDPRSIVFQGNTSVFYDVVLLSQLASSRELTFLITSGEW